MRRASGLLAIVLFGLAACAPLSADADEDGWRALALTSRAVRLDEEDPDRARVGSLLFAGGLELNAEDAAFGGLSALEVTEEGALTAVTDEGGWLSARLVLDEAGRLTGLTEPRMGRMRDAEGAVLARKEDADAEGLALLPDGRFAVSFERTQSLRLYDLTARGAAAPGLSGPRLAGIAPLDPNEGPEALAALPDGRLLAGAERAGGPLTPVWLLDPAAEDETPPRFQAPVDFGFGLVAMDALSSGDVIALQRFFAPVIGVRIRVVRIPAENFSGEGGTLRPIVLAELAPPLTLDNFEGVAAVETPNGLRLYLISDDNFSDRQRTLLLAFDVEG